MNLQMNKIRINKYLSMKGVCSRRSADAMILAGEILLNGEIAKPGDKVGSSDVLTVNGRSMAVEMTADEKKVVVAYNKPVGIVCSLVNQGKEKNNIIDAISYPLRIYPMGRLDKDSQGLILLTNDGDLNDFVIRSGDVHEKEYIVTVEGKITESFIKEMSDGVKILLKDDREYVTKPCKVKRLSANSFSIILTEGKNRQIRRMCKALGYDVKKLERIRVMHIELGNLKPGQYRELSEAEIRGFGKV